MEMLQNLRRGFILVTAGGSFSGAITLLCCCTFLEEKGYIVKNPVHT